MIKIDNGYKIKVGNVCEAAKSAFIGDNTLIPGRYRVTVRFGKKVVNQTPEFYVY
jgi:hypothetical protein